MEQMTMVQRTACPNCRTLGKDKSGDNLILYSDGGKHCFSCNYHHSSPTTEYLHKRLGTRTSSELCSNGGVQLPQDCISIPVEISYLNRKVTTWCARYQITFAEFQRWNLCYSPSMEMLIFPWMEDGSPSFWIGRNFGTEGTKYHTVGNVYKSLCVFSSDTGDHESVVAVEDWVSAIKVSRVVDAVCMFSSSLTKNNAMRLSKLYKNLIIWGDYDMAKQNMRHAKQYSSFFDKSRCVITKKDPKEYHVDQISRQVWAVT